MQREMTGIQNVKFHEISIVEFYILVFQEVFKFSTRYENEARQSSTIEFLRHGFIGIINQYVLNPKLLAHINSSKYHQLGTIL